MMSPPSFEEVCNELSVSGRLILEESSESIRIRKRTYPLLTFLWCSGIMGGVVYCFYRFSGDYGFTLAGAIISVILVALFTALSVYSDRKPPIIELDRSTGVLTAPRFPGLQLASEDVFLRLISASVVRYNQKTHTQILAVVSRGELTEIPIFCERSNALKSRVSAFAEKTSMAYEVCDKRSIRLS